MQATKNLIMQYYDSFNRQDMQTFLNLLDDDVVHDINQGGQERGKAAFTKFMQHMNHCYKEVAKDIVIMVNEEGTRAAAELIIEGTYLATDSGLPEAKGQTYRLACGAFFALANGKIIRVTLYYNLNEWLQQVQQ
jgi:steroid delta-isomerase-like uncharacterized protein